MKHEAVVYLFQHRFEIGINTKKLEMMEMDKEINNRQSNLKYLFKKKIQRELQLLLVITLE
jgi:hypothetical protein